CVYGTILTESVPLTHRPLVVNPVNVADVEDGLRPSDCVAKCSTRSGRPSPFPSSKDAISVPFFLASTGAPANLILESTSVLASKVSVDKTTTGTFPCEPRFIGLGPPSPFICMVIGMVLPALPALTIDCISD